MQLRCYLPSLEDRRSPAAAHEVRSAVQRLPRRLLRAADARGHSAYRSVRLPQDDMFDGAWPREEVLRTAKEKHQ
jgi:hypothetical protein